MVFCGEHEHIDIVAPLLSPVFRFPCTVADVNFVINHLDFFL